MILNLNILIVIILIFISLYFLSYSKNIPIIKENFSIRSCQSDCDNIFDYNILLPNEDKVEKLVKYYEKNTPCNGGYINLSPNFWN